MTIGTLITLNDSPAIVLSPEALEGTGWASGDKLEITISSEAIVISRPGDETRSERFERISNEIIERRRDAYERLA